MMMWLGCGWTCGSDVVCVWKWRRTTRLTLNEWVNNMADYELSYTILEATIRFFGYTHSLPPPHNLDLPYLAYFSWLLSCTGGKNSLKSRYKIYTPVCLGLHYFPHCSPHHVENQISIITTSFIFLAKLNVCAWNNAVKKEQKVLRKLGFLICVFTRKTMKRSPSFYSSCTLCSCIQSESSLRKI